MLKLERFEQATTTESPFRLDRHSHEYARRSKPRTSVARTTSNPTQLTVHCPDVLRAKERVADEAPGLLGRHHISRLEVIEFKVHSRMERYWAMLAEYAHT